MESDLEQVLERKRLRRKLTVWRVLAFGAAVLAVVVGFSAFTNLDQFEKQSPHIARIPISGFIHSSRYASKQLEKIRKDENVKAVIVAIDSPGGTTVGGEALHNAIRKIAKEKPVVSSIGGLAASAGYMVAVAADHIVAPRTSIVGSVGVLFQYPNATELFGKIGVSMEEIKSSPLKAEPSPFNETPPEAVAMLESMLLDTYQWFADLIKDRRSFSDVEADGLLDGSVFSGQQALKNKMIDQLGDEAVAKQWLVDEKEVPDDLEIVTWSLTKPQDPFLSGTSIAKSALKLVGLGELVALSEHAAPQIRNSNLDGFLSVWQAVNPSGTNRLGQ